MSGALIKLREGRQRRSSTWTVELYNGSAQSYSHTFKDRAEARRYARRLAYENDTIVVLAGPAKALVVNGGAA